MEKIVKNYFIKYCHSGIVEVIFNTNVGWVGYHAYNNTTYKFWIGDDSDESEEGDRYTEVLTIDGLKLNGMCLQTFTQDKDQIYVIFIPYKLLMDRKDKIAQI